MNLYPPQFITPWNVKSDRLYIPLVDEATGLDFVPYSTILSTDFFSTFSSTSFLSEPLFS